ncbi:hypothetical protein CRM22_001955 [Opisthorchis felineus]|uniref:Uncharacterized protein n=1 Tax=Opisthorchis felineus TaxID=147828 RepID=A0A4S2M881_OPIFE|nr:hypothetical protein CRM22_001955 [Opisthorchis felineus]TGZ72662.1 hypothetical protein CRM22_001955 [Opisthorchis felineus]
MPTGEQLISVHGTQVITELRARIQRLREENLSLRRLLLRRPVSACHLDTDALEEKLHSVSWVV